MKLKLVTVVTIISLIWMLASAAHAQSISGSITHDGGQREYILYVPTAYDGSEPVPLVFNFHGLGSNATQQFFYGNLSSIADTANFLVVHPEGLPFMGSQAFNSELPSAAAPVDDIGFTSALLDTLIANYNIDETRVYATGMSNGGFMSFGLACQLSDRIAAIASVTGLMSPIMKNDCNPQRPVPILQFHGTADSTVYYDQDSNVVAGISAYFVRTDSVLDYWATQNNCDPVPTITALPDINVTDGSTVEHYLFGNGDNGSVVEHYKIEGGEHTWPGAFISLGVTNQDINASQLIWEFFSRYDINGLYINTDVLTIAPTQAIDVYPNPTTSDINIKTYDGKPLQYELYSTLGQQLMIGEIHSHYTNLNISHLPAQLYILKVNGQTFRIIKQ